MIIKRILTVCAIVFCCAGAALSQAPVPGQWEVRERTATGMLSRGVTLNNGQVLGKVDGMPAAVTPFNGTFSALSGKPTTILGYGITNALVTTNNLSELTDAAAARNNLGLVIGANVQAYSGTLAAIAGGTWTGSTAITTLGTISAGTWSGTVIAVNKGGTGATSAADARTNLGLVIGTDVQAYDAGLAAIAAGTWTGAASITTVGTIASGTWQGGIIAPAYLGTGTEIGTKYLRGDGTWQTVSGGLQAANNLSDVADVGTARFNLSVQPTNSPVFTGTFRAAGSSSASGSNAISIGAGNTATGSNAASIGAANAAACGYSIVLGDNNTAGSGVNVLQTFILGTNISATPQAGNRANTLVGRNHTLSNTVNAGSTFTSGAYGVVRHSHERLHANAEYSGRNTQCGEVILTRTTSLSATPAELFIDDNTISRSFNLVAGQAYDCFIRVMGRRSDGGAHAVYWRRVLIQRTGATTSLPAAVQTIGTDVETDATWDVSITANDTADRLVITVTGTASHTIAWTAHIIFNELTY